MRCRSYGIRVSAPGRTLIVRRIKSVWITPNPNALGVITFVASPDHNTIVRSYTVNIYVLGSGTVLRAMPIGKPPVNGVGDVVYDINSLLSSMSNGNYTLKILSIADTGSSESDGVDFSLPLV